MDILINGRDVLIIDVRPPAEFKEMRINDERVKWVPLGKLRSSLSDIPGDRKIITFCKKSLRGYEASKILSGAGFANVDFMDGGIAMWPFEIDRSTVTGI